MSALATIKRWLGGGVTAQQIERFNPSFQAYVDQRMLYGGRPYPLTGFTMTGKKSEPVTESYEGYVLGAYRSNSVVFGVSNARMRLFSEARFKFRRFGDPGSADLFGDPRLAKLEKPWPGGTTRDLLNRMEQDVTNSGNAYVADEGDRLRRLRPDWTEIILAAPPAEAIDSDIVGYRYTAGGPLSGGESQLYLREQVAHWMPIPDPMALYRGMSWVTPILREIMADGAATDHKLAFFENGATVNLVVTLKETVTAEQYKEFVQASQAAHRGAMNAYETMYVGGGADVTPVGANMQQMDFKQTQGAGETRIAMAGGVPPIIVGLSEGLQAATYSNYGQARRGFGDLWARPQWASVCGALSVIMPAPDAGSELWYDDRDIAFLREDQMDRAQIQSTEAATIASLLQIGYESDSVTAALGSQDWSKLIHSGLYSVQLQPPGVMADPAAVDPAAAPADPTAVA